MGRAMRKVPAAALAEDFQDFIVAHFPKILKESAYGKKWFRRGEVNQIVGNGTKKREGIGGGHCKGGDQPRGMLLAQIAQGRHHRRPCSRSIVHDNHYTILRIDWGMHLGVALATRPDDGQLPSRLTTKVFAARDVFWKLGTQPDLTGFVDGSDAQLWIARPPDLADQDHV